MRNPLTLWACQPVRVVSASRVAPCSRRKSAITASFFDGVAPECSAGALLVGAGLPIYPASMHIVHGLSGYPANGSSRESKLARDDWASLWLWWIWPSALPSGFA
jgi:hypothetical protein